jgi:ABC-type polysaccharide/polyol phosphate export permease
MITWKEIKIRYKQSVMGALWAVLMPLVIVSAGSLVRYAFATLSGTPLQMGDLIALAVKSTPYAFFVASIRFGTSSLVSNANLITKIYMPRLVFPVAAVMSQLFDFAVATALLVPLVLIAGVGVSLQLLWLPVLFIGLVLVALGFAIVLSAASLFFRDVKYLVEVILTFAVFFTPVFYDSKMLGHWAPLVLLNPLAPLLEAVSAVVVGHHSPSLGWVTYSLGFGVVFGALSVLMFRKLDPYFAESV